MNATILAMAGIIVILQELIGKKLLKLNGTRMIICGFVLGAILGIFCGCFPGVVSSFGLSVEGISMGVIILDGLIAAGVAMGLWGTATRILGKVGNSVVKSTKKVSRKNKKIV